MPDARVLVVDPHRSFADALARRLSLEEGLDVVGTAQTGEQARRLASLLRPDVVTLEVDTGTTEAGVALAHDLHELGAAVVVVSALDDGDVAVALARAGVRSWVSKSAELGDVLDAVRGAPEHESHLPPRLLAEMLERLTAPDQLDPEAELLAPLTPRERDVLRCLMTGMDRATLAATLFLAENTVRTHVQSVRRKLNVRSSLEAVAVARRAGVHPWEPTVR